jgi:hypothetical protein
MRHWVVAGTALPVLAFSVLASAGYLPVVGPVPLRFRQPALPATNLVRMTLPPPETEPATASIPDNAEAKKTAPAPNPPPAAPPPAASPTVATNPAEPAATPASEPMISPQMLMKYFNRSTNGVSGGILAPVDFAPPAPAKPPSSTATYSTNPD